MKIEFINDHTHDSKGGRISSKSILTHSTTFDSMVDQGIGDPIFGVPVAVAVVEAVSVVWQKWEAHKHA